MRKFGIATASRLPSISLTADAGSTALKIGQLFESGTGFWSLGADVTAPIFQGGTLLHRERAAEAAYVQAAEQYRSTVLSAFQNVADTLAAIEHDAEGLKAAARRRNRRRPRWICRNASGKPATQAIWPLLSAEQGYQQAALALVQAQANRYADTAALFQALGGGWWHRAELVQDDPMKADAIKSDAIGTDPVGNDPRNAASNTTHSNTTDSTRDNHGK